MFSPGKHTEAEALVGFLDQQLSSIRASAHGLTDEQARSTPCRSTLSVGGVVKHVTYIMESRARHHRASDAMPDAEGFAQFMGSFVLTEDETLEGILEEFDRVRAVYLDDVRSAEPGADMVAPPTPWDGVYAPTPSVQRFALIHHIEEFARHAGHADILREEVDGATAAALQMALEGRPGNAFVQPWEASS